MTDQSYRLEWRIASEAAGEQPFRGSYVASFQAVRGDEVRRRAEDAAQEARDGEFRLSLLARSKFQIVFVRLIHLHDWNESITDLPSHFDRSVWLSDLLLLARRNGAAERLRIALHGAVEHGALNQADLAQVNSTVRTVSGSQIMYPGSTDELWL